MFQYKYMGLRWVFCAALCRT